MAGPKKAPSRSDAKGGDKKTSLARSAPMPVHITIEPISNGHVVRHATTDKNGVYSETKTFMKKLPSNLAGIAKTK